MTCRPCLNASNLVAWLPILPIWPRTAAKEGLSHEVYLYELAKQEEAVRDARRTERLLRQSGLPLEKTFRTFEKKRLSPALQLQIERLKNGAFLEQAINVIALGKPGVGKTRSTHYPY